MTGMGDHADGFGIDIGGSGIKGAPVDLDSGEFTKDRVRIPTPDKSTPENVAEVVVQVLAEFDYEGPVGICFPAVVRHGIARSAANVDKSWIGTDLRELFGHATGRHVHAVNDADAAGLAEVRYGAGKEAQGVVLVATLGTGIGSALFVDGTLVPNTELGHLEIEGFDAETRASDAARDREDLSWEKWGKRLTTYFTTIERLFSPDLIIIGGGVSKKADKYLPYVEVETPIVPALLRNDAGIIGAALLASDDG